jgi:hypothetical protein
MVMRGVPGDVMMSENNNGHRSVWQQVSTEEPFIWTHYLVRFDHSELFPQNRGRGGGLVLSSHHLCGGEEGGEKKGGGRRRGEETEGHPRIIRIAWKSKTIHTWSDRASKYFVSVEDNIKPGSIPSDTLPPSTQRKIIYNNNHNNIIFLCTLVCGIFYSLLKNLFF